MVFGRNPIPLANRPLAWLSHGDTLFRPWLLLLIPPLGGLLSGWLVFRFAPEAEGHGTDSVIAAYHQRGGYMRPRVPAVKIVASALTIGFGGSGGREGPIAQIGAGFGSMLAGALRLRAAERRVLLAAGMGAGIAAIFRAPLAGALFAAEVLYWSPEFEPEVILPAAIASVVSYCVFGAFAGWKPLFDIPPLAFDNPRHLLIYSLLIVAMIVLASLYVRTFYGVTKLFHNWSLPRTFKPAVGGFLSGAIGLALYYAFGRDEQLLAVLGFGYQALQNATQPNAHLSASVLLAIALGKILTTSLTIGSGGSGGVFGPSMVIGGCGGGALGLLLSDYLGPAWRPDIANFVVVGMAGFFAAAAKTPFSTLIMVSELTGGYDLLLPTLWVCSLAFMLSDNRSIYSSQVECRSLSPAHQGSFSKLALKGVLVRDIVPLATPPLVHPRDPLATILAMLQHSGMPVLPVADEEGKLLGVIDIGDLCWSGADDSRILLVADDLMRTDIEPLRPDDELDRAFGLFIENDLLALPIIDNVADRRVIGVARRSDIAGACLRRLQGGD